MFKKLIGIIVIIFIINSAGVLFIGGGAAGVAADREPVRTISNVMVIEAIGNVDNVPQVQSRADELRALFKRILAEEAATVKTFDGSSSNIYNCKSIMAMAIITSEFKNLRKIHLMNYLLCKRILHVHPDAVNHYLTLNFMMLERSILEIDLTTRIIEDQLEYVKNGEAIELGRRILAAEKEIVNHLYSFYKVFESEQ